VKRWHHKIRHLLGNFHEDGEKLSGVYQKEKEKLLILIDKLDIEAETILSKCGREGCKEGGR
jgi:hypothetical protein